jgi:hypothetical protein
MVQLKQAGFELSLEMDTPSEASFMLYHSLDITEILYFSSQQDIDGPSLHRKHLLEDLGVAPSVLLLSFTFRAKTPV